MIGEDTVVKVVCPIGEAVQMNIEILKAGVILGLDGHSEAAAYAGIDAVGCDQISTADKLFLLASIGMRDPRRDTVRLQGTGPEMSRCIRSFCQTGNACNRARTFRSR